MVVAAELAESSSGYVVRGERVLQLCSNVLFKVLGGGARHVEPMHDEQNAGGGENMSRHRITFSERIPAS